MRRVTMLVVGALGAAGIAIGSVSLASASSSPNITRAQTLHLVAPVKGSITTPTMDLTTFMGPVTDRAGKRVGNLQGYCVTIEDKTGSAECTTTIFLSSSQITLTGPTYNRQVQSRFDQAVAGGTGRYQNARGQAAVTLLKNKDVEYDVNLIP